VADFDFVSRTLAKQGLLEITIFFHAQSWELGTLINVYARKVEFAAAADSAGTCFTARQTMSFFSLTAVSSTLHSIFLQSYRLQMHAHCIPHRTTREAPLIAAAASPSVSLALAGRRPQG
jgi:hypothetical protein